jgi:hypothetical protein
MLTKMIECQRENDQVHVVVHVKVHVKVNAHEYG